MRISQWWQDYEWELLEALMILMRLIKWVFFALCAWYVKWLLNQ